MENYLSRIDKIKKGFPALGDENFTKATTGTHYKVFVSENYVVRFRDDNPDLLKREADLLKKLDHPLIPKVLWLGKIDGFGTMAENRLVGQTLDSCWKDLSKKGKTNIVNQVFQFLKYLKKQKQKFVYSVNTGKKYSTFLDCLVDDMAKKVSTIKKFKQTKGILRDLFSIINNPEIAGLFADNKKEATLVHGDLIIHNLLTDGKNLTGVLDWELALFGDSDYDLFRLFYYQECAKAYQEQGIDEIFEADYMNQLMVLISDSDLIEDKDSFQKKYSLVRAVFYLNALHWAAKSDKPKKNIEELLKDWDKKTS